MELKRSTKLRWGIATTVVMWIIGVYWGLQLPLHEAEGHTLLRLGTFGLYAFFMLGGAYVLGVSLPPNFWASKPKKSKVPTSSEVSEVQE